MMLVDTSVWIDYLNGVRSPHTDALDAGIVDGIVVMGDLIFLEILQGIRDDREYEITRRSLETLEFHEVFGTAMAGKCAENFRTLRKHGITIRKTADVIIATFCIERRMPLLFTDRDFVPFVEHLGLRPVMLQT